jgi:hypothetical protein
LFALRFAGSWVSIGSRGSCWLADSWPWDGWPADYCRRRVRECEIYVAVVGFRYGSLVAGEVVSFTELEFLTASEAGLPRLIFLMGEAASPPGLGDPDRSAVAGFRRRLADAGLVVRAFTTSDGLELEVFHALSELVGEVPPAGPLPGANELVSLGGV